jgi:hypothetical protein
MYIIIKIKHFKVIKIYMIITFLDYYSAIIFLLMFKLNFLISFYNYEVYNNLAEKVVQ